VRVVHVATWDNQGGACRAAYRVHDGLKRLRIDSQMYVRTRLSGDPTVWAYQPSQALVIRVRRRARRLALERAMHRYDKTSPPGRSHFADDRSFFWGDVIRQVPTADLVHVHWVSQFVDYGVFFPWLSVPLVWTLHDMANFTGGCCYDLGCDRFVAQCGACPQLGSSGDDDLSRHIWLRKKRHYSHLDAAHVHIVTPSRWLATQVARAPLLCRFDRSVIPYGLDLDVFKPRDPRVVRELLGIAPDARVVLFVAHSLAERRKGFGYLLDALREIPSAADVWLLSVGLGGPVEVPHIRHRHFDSLSDDRMLSFYYSAADVLVVPSSADNLPNTILESMACGTPVIAFDAGGMPELVRPGVTGLLVPTGNTAQLRQAILQLLSELPMRSELSANCRRISTEEYDLGVQASRYADIYESMLDGTRRQSITNEQPVTVKASTA